MLWCCRRCCYWRWWCVVAVVGDGGPAVVVVVAVGVAVCSRFVVLVVFLVPVLDRVQSLLECLLLFLLFLFRSEIAVTAGALRRSSIHSPTHPPVHPPILN